MAVGVSRPAIAFQHTAARRRLADTATQLSASDTVSTHSRPKAAGSSAMSPCERDCCFNTQPPEGGWCDTGNRLMVSEPVSTHSRPKAAGYNFNHTLMHTH